MPKVSAEHRAARREQIVQAAWRCVAREGFHKTTMAQIIAESGLSAGAVYGYFRSKEELIAAIADRAVGTIDEVFDELDARDPVPSPLAIMHRLTSHAIAITRSEHGDLASVALQAWAEAVLNPEVKRTVAGKYTAIRRRFAALVKRLQAEGRLDPRADPEEVAQVMFGMMPGFVVQRLVLGDVTPSSYTAGLEALLTTAPGR